jgi:hypothetical protein
MSNTENKKEGGATEPYLKGKNAAYLWSFVGINVAIFLCMLVNHWLSIDTLDQSWHRVTLKNGIFAAAIPTVAVVLAGILGASAKARLVFWRWRNPGCRVFSGLLKTDPRLDATALRAKLGKFPTGAKAQNALWFGIYKRHRAKLRVLESHKHYLLTREMTAIAAAFLVLLSAGIMLRPPDAKVTGLYVLALIVQYLLVASAARNYGNRFVLNVLSEELHG